MEKRTPDYYENCPAMARFCLDGENFPEFIALMLAMIEHKNVTLKPEYVVWIYGRIANPPTFNPDLKRGDLVTTSRIKGVYFEKVYGDGEDRLETYIQTANTSYLVWPEIPSCTMWAIPGLLEKIKKEGLKFEDYKDYFSNINENYTEYEFVNEEPEE